MSRRLAPFSLALTYPTDPRQFYFTNLVYPVKRKMDIATNPVLKAFLAGSFSGTCSTILFQPLDLVKTRLQNIAINNQTPAGLLTPKQHLSMFSVVRHVLQTEHISGLWRGIMPSITRTVPGVGIYFSSLHWLKNHAGFSGKEPSALEAVCLGMAARTLAGCLMIPITVVKTRFESGTYNYHGISGALTQIYAKEGIRGLCCGLAPTLIRDAPYSGLYLMFYSQLKQNALPLIGYHHNHNNHNDLAATSAKFTCGIVAGVLASLVTHPADVVKTKMQLKPLEFGSVLKTISAILKLEGPSGFLVGVVPRMLRRTLMSALAWTVYEQMMHRMGLK